MNRGRKEKEKEKLLMDLLILAEGREKKSFIHYPIGCAIWLTLCAGFLWYNRREHHKHVVFEVCAFLSFFYGLICCVEVLRVSNNHPKIGRGLTLAAGILGGCVHCILGVYLG